jgi:hypothetical protein
VEVDVSPSIGLEAGTVSVAADAGLTFRIGARLDRDFGAPRAGSLGGLRSRKAGDGFSGYLFASANARYQAYDLVLDEEGGDPVCAGSAITRGKGRNEASVGFALACNSTRLTFAMTDESKRYDQQSER